MDLGLTTALTTFLNNSNALLSLQVQKSQIELTAAKKAVVVSVPAKVDDPVVLPIPIIVGATHNIPVAPYSVTGIATWFGLNPDGSDDKGDMDAQGHDLTGAFGDETHNKTLVGISIPIPVFKATIGTGDTVYADVRKRRYVLDVLCLGTGKHVTGVYLVDLGPKAILNRTADMTYGLATALGLRDNSIITYWITDTVTGKILPIRGWNFNTGAIA